MSESIAPAGRREASSVLDVEGYTRTASLIQSYRQRQLHSRVEFVRDLPQYMTSNKLLQGEGVGLVVEVEGELGR